MSGTAAPLLKDSLYLVGIRSPIARLAALATLGIAIAFCCAGAAARWGDAVAGWTLPAMRSVLQNLMPEFHISSFWLSERLGQAQFDVQALLVQPLQIGHRTVHGSIVATAHVTLGAFWQPVAAAIATAAIWPRFLLRSAGADSYARRGRNPIMAPLLASALGATLAGVLATALSAVLAPTMMAGLMIGQIYWHEASDQIIPLVVRLPRFLEEGGWLMLGMLVGALLGLAAGAASATVARAGAANPDCVEP